MKLKEALKGKLTPKEFDLLKGSYDTLGSIAIIEIPPELEKKEKLIGNTLLDLQKNIRTVAKKTGIHSGEFRLRKLKIIAGRRSKETEYKENNVRLLLHAEKVYFSPRLSTERKRIMEKVRPGETVLVMFSGVGPYVFVISRNTGAREVYGVEVNPEAHKYALRNRELNKAQNVKLYLGDVRKVVPKIRKRFDRIIMPLPRGAENFLDTALAASRRGTTIHFYDFEREEEMPDASFEKIRKAAGRKEYEILGWNRCGNYGPGKYRVCVDFRVM
ncbi:MAG: class I SAM-dependent methyltransferase family protein [Candidatus Woesearchaeota archaeon]